MPPTFQSWFTVANLHVWLLTVRLRSLPDPEARHYIQGLIDHFFMDVEERVRAVLQPLARNPRLAPKPPTAFYKNPHALGAEQNVEPVTSTGKKRPRGNAPELIVTRQMKIFKEQWAGLGMSFDLALGSPSQLSDTEMAGAVWRNFLGGRGARGIVYPNSPNAQNYFRRSINLVGGQVESVKKVDEKGLENEERRDDGSGVSDYSPEDAEKYVQYPELMESVVAYVRRELVRLEKIGDEDITGTGDVGKESEGIEKLRFGKIL